MKYRRALLIADLLTDAQPIWSALRGVAPELDYVLVVSTQPTSGRSTGTASEERLRALEALSQQARIVATSASVDTASPLDAATLIRVAGDADIDLLVMGSRSLRDAAMVADVQKQLLLPILWPAEHATAQAIERILCVPLGRAGRASLATFLRDHADPSLKVTLLSAALPPAEKLASVAEISGIRTTLETARGTPASLRRLLTDQASRQEFDLAVLTRVPAALIPGIAWPTSVLLLPRQQPFTTSRLRALDVADAIDAGGSLRTRIGYELTVGSLSPVDSVQIAFVSEGRTVAATRTSPDGEVEIAAGATVNSLGVLRTGETPPVDVVAEIERQIRVLRPGGRPLLVFDAELDDEVLLQQQRRPDSVTREPLAVRLRPTRSIRAIRDRLRRLQLDALVVDARAVLDEGPALDVFEALDSVRLMRVASRLRDAGFGVAGVLPRGRAEPLPLDRTDAAVLEGNRIEIELDNACARRWTLQVIGESRRTLHLQVYMAADDAVAQSIVDALGNAATRGVRVRVLVNSLLGHHGSFGTENPLLTRLSEHAGVELRVSHPVNEIPTLADLKQRDHRKLLISDGRLALLGGRNLASEYYSGFDEAPITARSLWRELPWLDAGARVAGPAVTALESAFCEAWLRAGGASFEIQPGPPAGTTKARVIIHHGLRDTATLEAYRELIESARSHVDVVNGFPLVLELQHALLGARRRGIRVRVLTGHVAPTHAGQPFAGAWAAARAVATELVHSRLDPLLEAGCEIYSFAKRDVPGWAPDLGVVHPHVHAKVISVDGQCCAVGSANFDITASYCESEVLLITFEPGLAQVLEVQINRLMAASTRWSRDDPSWKKAAARRDWMRHWPGLLSV